MAKPEWGKKRSCPSCGSKFYDLRKDPIVCPSCGEQIDPDAGGKASKRSRSQAKDTSKARKPAAAAPAAADEKALDDPAEELEVSDDYEAAEGDDADYGGEDDSPEDTTELGEDDLPGVAGDEEEDS